MKKPIDTRRDAGPTARPGTVPEALRRRLGVVKPQPRLLLAPPPSTKVLPAPGCVYVIRGTADQESVWAVVIAFHRPAVVNLVPIIPEPGMAGPEDVLLPHVFFGHPAAAALRLEFSLRPEDLPAPEGMLPADAMAYVCNARAGILSGKTEGFRFGMPWLNQHDCRLDYHAAIAATVEHVQEPLVQALPSMERADPVLAGGWSIFPGLDVALQAEPLAAADGTESHMKELEARYAITGQDLFLDLCVDGKSVCGWILTRNGKPSRLLDGACLATKNDEAAARVKAGYLQVPCAEIVTGFKVYGPDGNLLKLTAKRRARRPRHA